MMRLAIRAFERGDFNAGLLWLDLANRLMLLAALCAIVACGNPTVDDDSGADAHESSDASPDQSDATPSKENPDASSGFSGFASGLVDCDEYFDHPTTAGLRYWYKLFDLGVEASDFPEIDVLRCDYLGEYTPVGNPEWEYGCGIYRGGDFLADGRFLAWCGTSTATPLEVSNERWSKVSIIVRGDQ